MDGIEFRVPRQAHKKVEDFLAGNSEGVHGIQLEVTNLDWHADVATAARSGGCEVTVDPMTERLCHLGFATDRVPFADLYPLSQVQLARSAPARAELAERLVEVQRPHVTSLTPAHFFVSDSDDIGLNLAMIHQARALAPDEPLRPILAIESRFLSKKAVAATIGRAYRDAGIERLELRVSPLGGQDMGPVKIRNTLVALGVLKAAGLEVLLAESGVMGHAAVALGLASSFSVGVGYWEQYNHASTVKRQQKNAEPRAEDEDEQGPRGAQASVVLPGAEIAVTRKIAKALYDEPSVRAKLGCHLGKCANSVDGPLLDVRAHYIHSQASAVASMMDQPSTWRPTLLRDRLAGALDRRAELWKALPDEIVAPKSRTLASLVEEVNRRQGTQAA